MKQFLSHESSSEKNECAQRKGGAKALPFCMQKILVYPLFALSGGTGRKSDAEPRDLFVF